MEILRIRGGMPLSGRIKVQGSKNSALPILAATVLTRGETVLHNCPELSDVEAAMSILRHLGCRAQRRGSTVFVDSSRMTGTDVPDKLMREMRSSVIFLGAILARAGEVRLSQPGGCELGPRPIDLHLKALRALGASVSGCGGEIICRAGTMRGCRVNFPMPSVGATENAMLAACGCSGRTVITNAACEPEIADLAAFLRKLGVNISGAGTSVVTIEGKPLRRFAEHSVMPDRIAAATYLCACASAGGKITLSGAVPSHVETVTDALSAAGCGVSFSENEIHIERAGNLKAVGPISTAPYPGFPTDAQPPLMAALLRASGTTAFTENIFENRFRHVPELQRMGADIRTNGRVALVSGVKKLCAAPVVATDLRGGASLIVAALGAEGASEISALHHVKRGYENIALALASLGADAKETVI